jgi:hypothetical protein
MAPSQILGPLKTSYPNNDDVISQQDHHHHIETRLGDKVKKPMWAARKSQELTSLRNHPTQQAEHTLTDTAPRTLQVCELQLPTNHPRTC